MLLFSFFFFNAEEAFAPKGELTFIKWCRLTVKLALMQMVTRTLIACAANGNVVLKAVSFPYYSVAAWNF